MTRAAAFALLTVAALAIAQDRPKEAAGDAERITSLLKRDFHARGQAKMDRIELDEVQRACNLHGDNPPAELAKRLEEGQMKSIAFPAGSLLGSWQAGERIAQNGRGMTWSDKPGEAGGSCYNCHRISPKEEAHGTIGPSLAGFGRIRGTGAEIQRYVYGKIWNSKAYNACSQMPRFGASGTLTEQQVKDLTALLLDPASPVNQ
jgi:sulfur-oxidizing protein SoxX